MSGDPFRVDPAGLPDELSKWRALNWAVETIDGDPRKIPKQPSNPARNAKSNNGSTWGAFDQALENALENDELGLGFPCAQPGHPFVFIDVDIPGSDEWVPAFDRLGGAIVERSPSGGSRRVILTGCNVPEWWKNQSEKNDDDETREVKVFTDTGYVTLTGDTIEGFGTPLEAIHSKALDQWLREAWLAFNDLEDDGTAPWEGDGRAQGGSPGADPPGDAPETRGRGGDEWLTADVASEALDHIDPDLHHDEWVGVGFALVNHFGTATGGSLFKNWSRGGRKWHEPDAERVIEDAGGYPHGAGHFVNGAKQYGWDASAAARAANVNAPPEGATDGGTVAATSAGETAPEDVGDVGGDSGLPDPASFGFDAHNGGYGYWSQETDDEPAEWSEWTNFELEVESFLSLKDGSEEIALTVHPRHGESYEVRVPPTAFNEKREFKRDVACGRTATFTGGETALAKIKTFVGTQSAPDQLGVRHMGRRGDSLVVPGGSLTTDGWDESPETRYVERSLGIERKVALSPEYEMPDDGGEIAEILELLPQTRDPERFLPALGWFYAAPLRPLITDHTGEFPLLSITGNTGAGKTSTLETLSQLLGVGSEPFSANDTKFTLTTTLSATDTLPTWYDEYKPSDMADYQVDTFHDLIRKSTRGGIESRGNADKSTDEYHLEAPVAVSGEQRFGGPAEQRRSILTTFRESATDPDGEAAHAFAKLVGGSFNTGGEIVHYDGTDLLAHAHAYHRWLLAYDADDVREAWRDAEERVLSLLEVHGIGDVDSAGRTALQTAAFGVGLYRAFANDVGANVPITDDDRDQALVYVANQQGNDGRRESHLDEFVRYLSLAAMENELEEERHYTRVYKADQGTEIRVSMSKAYPKVARFVQNHGLSSTAELLGEGDYRQRIKEAADESGSYITSYSQNSPPIGRAFGIKATDAEDAVEGFDGEDFYGRDEQGENGRYPSDRDPDEEHWRSEQ